MLVDRLKKARSNQFFRNIGWLGIAELVNRVFRLGTTVVLARIFSQEDMGLMGIIYIAFEFGTLIPQRGGMGNKIIQADDRDLWSICETAYWLQWIICGLTVVIQCIGAFIYGLVSGNEQIILPLCVASIAYLIFPMCINNVSLLERSNRMDVSAICNALQAMLSNLTIVTFVSLGMGIWSIVLSILISTPIWWILSWKHNSWRPPKRFHIDSWREIFDFSKNLLGFELLNKLRMNLDYFIVNLVLGLEDFGLYYFAFNAGSGITLNIVNSITGAIFPHLCSARGNMTELSKNYRSSIKTIFYTLVPVVLLQSALAPIYVPIVYSSKWFEAIPIIMIICLSVIPYAFSLTSFLLLNAIDRTNLTLRLDLIFTIIFALALIVSVQWGIYAVAIAVTLCNWLVLPISSIWTTRYVFKGKGSRELSRK